MAREIGVLHDDAVVGGEGWSDARRVGSEHHDAGLHVQRLQRLEDADDEGPTSEVQECLGPTHSFRGPGSQHHPRETHAITLSRVAPRRQTPKLAAHGRTTHSPAGRSDPAGPLRAGPRSEEHTSELQSLAYLVCRLLLEKKKKISLC